MKPIIVIPSYWARPKKDMTHTDMIYDHPTPLDGKGTLRRCLDSLELLDCKEGVDVLVLAASTDESISKDVKERIHGMLKRKKLPVNVKLFSDYDLRGLHMALEKVGYPACNRLLSLYGYSNIRNLSLFIPYVLGYDTVISIDDDEVITPNNSDYLTKIFSSVKKGYRGIAGYYTHKNDPAVVVKTHPWSEVIDKSTLMKSQLDKLCNGKNKLNPTFFALGGNLVLTKEVFTKIPYDPEVSRGEDMDYVMNARFFGETVYFQKDLFIEHLPPSHSQPHWLNMRKEIVRFTYQYSKLLNQTSKSELGQDISPVSASDMGIYPGEFLRRDAYKLFERMNKSLDKYYIENKDNKSREEIKINFELIKQLEKSQDDSFEKYMHFQKHWVELMKVADENREKLSKSISGLIGTY